MTIRNEVRTRWAEQYKTTPTLYANETLPDPFKTKPFVMLEMDFLDPITVTYGQGTTTRHRGNIYVTVNVPLGSGTKQAMTLADEVLEVFERIRLGDVVCRSGSIEDEFDDGEHFAIVVKIPFTSTV